MVIEPIAVQFEGDMSRDAPGHESQMAPVHVSYEHRPGHDGVQHDPLTHV